MTESLSPKKSHEELLAEARANIQSRQERFGSLATLAAMQQADQEVIVQDTAQDTSSRPRISQEVPITI